MQQTLDLVAVGCQIVRITAPTVKDAANLQNIVAGLARARLPGADRRRHPFQARSRDGSGEVGREGPHQPGQLRRLEEVRDQGIHRRRNTPRSWSASRSDSRRWCCSASELGRAMRIGTNHGSLSDRIMNRFGDTPLGMVESALEFARIARKHDFPQLHVLDEVEQPEGDDRVLSPAGRAPGTELGPDWNYPIHLGVTEAGEGEDGRIKSAIGIGSLLCDGLGDTIRVSLTEDSGTRSRWRRRSSRRFERWPKRDAASRSVQSTALCRLRSLCYTRRESHATSACGIEASVNGDAAANRSMRVVVTRERRGTRSRTSSTGMGDVPAGGDLRRPERAGESIRATQRRLRAATATTQLVTVKDGVDLPVITAFRLLAAQPAMARHPILLKDYAAVPQPDAAGADVSATLLRASVDHRLAALRRHRRRHPGARRSRRRASRCGSLTTFCRRPAAAFSRPTTWPARAAAGRCSICRRPPRGSKTRTAHLKGVKIAIMGCIVNGPGEMADADFGYVGGAPGKINLYVGKTAGEIQHPGSRSRRSTST